LYDRAVARHEIGERAAGVDSHMHPRSISPSPFDPGEDGAVATHVTRRPQALPPSSWALPDPSVADDSGVVGFGADLAPQTLVDAYRRGIFPWPHDGLPTPWFSPDPRGVIPVDGIHVSRSLRQRLRRCEWTTTVDVAFEPVVAACATRRTDEGTWITSAMR